MQELEGSLVVLEAQQASMDEAAQSHHAEVFSSHGCLFCMVQKRAQALRVQTSKEVQWISCLVQTCFPCLRRWN